MSILKLGVCKKGCWSSSGLFCQSWCLPLEWRYSDIFYLLALPLQPQQPNDAKLKMIPTIRLVTLPLLQNFTSLSHIHLTRTAILVPIGNMRYMTRNLPCVSLKVWWNRHLMDARNILCVGRYVSRGRSLGSIWSLIDWSSGLIIWVEGCT